MPSFFDTNISYLKGVGPKRAELLKTELGIHTFADLLHHYPFRHEDRSRFYSISEIDEDLPSVQVKGRLSMAELVGDGRKKRLVAHCSDSTGSIELVWFKGHKWIKDHLKPGSIYVVFGKPARYGRSFSIAHPEMDLLEEYEAKGTGLVPVYPLTEKLRNGGLDSKAIAKLQAALLPQAYEKIAETLPDSFLKQYQFLGKREAVAQIHYPKDTNTLAKAEARLKFEELFYLQLKLLGQKQQQQQRLKGQIFNKVSLLTRFYQKHLPFDLTNAQKRVVKEIYADCKTGLQMNRLLQGDVGSGKTIVAFICMLMAIDSGAQACLMAPTEILASQHYQGLKEFADILGIPIAKLTGSVKKSARKPIHEALQSGELKILVGTHALIEDTVNFQNLGLCVIDEQHRFGVAQRAKLWKKASVAFPHILVMTATPIPRTLAMTLYGDLEVSVIDELPAGRKPIQTMHFFEGQRLRTFGFMKEQIKLGRQVYMVYPLIEESEKLDYKNLQDGYESISRAFPGVPLSMVHGRMKPEDKEFEMRRFVNNETKIMVATTVIEVGVNVPNASVMVIENAEKFGLSQLHQLRGRVGRGAEQSYCILMTGQKLSKEAKVRIKTMVETNNGFHIADVDLKLRGPGDLAGTQQSGVLDLKFADLAKDAQVLTLARAEAKKLLEEDAKLAKPENACILRQLNQMKSKSTNWSRIS